MDVRDRIIAELERIESENGVVVFYAVESGSRAWGFESRDSDYDVRFLYYHPLEWYLGLEGKRDVIERPLDDELDICGWDVRKALRLARKSNPSLMEWLGSPIVYKQRDRELEAFRKVVPEYYSGLSCFYHYLSMAGGNFKEYLKKDEVWLKKYFYVLRPVLACRWIERYDRPAPVLFDELLAGTIEDEGLLKVIGELLERKKAGDELDAGPRIEELNVFLEEEIRRLEDCLPEPKNLPGYELLNAVFKEIVQIK